jgi:hypothetical protein
MLPKTPNISSFHTIIDKQGSVMSTQSKVQLVPMPSSPLGGRYPTSMSASSAQVTHQADDLRTPLVVLLTRLTVRPRLVFLFFALACQASLSVAGDLYRWNDGNDNPVMSDRPPPAGTPYTIIDVGRYGATTNVVSPVTNPASNPVSTGTNREDAKDGGSMGNPEVAATVRIEKLPELCTQAKEAIFQLETFPRVRVTDNNGEVRFMTDTERTEQLNRAREVEAANC